MLNELYSKIERTVFKEITETILTSLALMCLYFVFCFMDDYGDVSICILQIESIVIMWGIIIVIPLLIYRSLNAIAHISRRYTNEPLGYWIVILIFESITWILNRN